MLRLLILSALMPATATLAQTGRPHEDFPARVTIARNSFIDIGPPFDYYDVYILDQQGVSLSVQHVLVTPGVACKSAASVEVQSATTQKTMSEMLGGQNPCDIPDKELKREVKRCKHCLTFSGANLTMEVSCHGANKTLDLKVLDRDMFAAKPNTPAHTTWAATVLGNLDGEFGSSPMSKPIFAVEPSPDAMTALPDVPIIESLKSGALDHLFKSDKPLSHMYSESRYPIPQPAVKLISVTPVTPLKSQVPAYPPIARAARVEGTLTADFDVSREGRASSPFTVTGPKLLESGVGDALAGWEFPPTDAAYKAEAKFEFSLNCAIK